MITIDWIDDHNSQSQNPFAMHRGPGTLIGGLGEFRHLFVFAQSHHRSMLELARRVRQGNQRPDSKRLPEEQRQKSDHKAVFYKQTSNVNR